jgi:hypothetical protein
VAGVAEKILLVGDNPFHGISHLSQERSRTRGDTSTRPEFAADLVKTSIQNGANGFMFSVSETTLSILKKLRETNDIQNLSLYAIVPYAYEYVRLATQLGGFPGLAKKFGRELVASRNMGAIASGLRGVMGMSPVALLKAYLSYEISRIKSAAGKHARIDSVLLHEVITDLALALDLDWLFESYTSFLLDHGITPGFNTCNFACLVKKLRDSNIDLRSVIIAAPFNKVGFQMNPSRGECEKALAGTPEPIAVAISIMAAGYLRLPEAIDYIAALPNVRGVAVGVSKESHARETFKLIREKIV